MNEINSCARHVFRDYTMKKVLTFAIMALLLGGFAFNANAQERSTKAASEKKATKTEVTKSKTDMEKTVKDFEQAVDKCVSLYKAIKGQDTKAKSSTKDFDNALAKAEKLKSTIEKSKDQLNRSQAERFQKAVDKLKQVYIK